MTTTAEHFFQSAQQYFTQGDTLLAAFHADSALWRLNAAAFPTIAHAADNERLRSDISSLAAQLPHQAAHYRSLLEAAMNQALATRERAHAPFSNFLVGATLIAADESLFIGCNVECSSYGLTICAERTALVSGVAQGKKQFAAVVVAADTDELTPPCGACRQLLYDFAPDAVVILINLKGQQKRFTMKELLPEAFSIAFLQ